MKVTAVAWGCLRGLYWAHCCTLSILRRLLISSISMTLLVVTKTWNDLKPPKTIYNHLQPPQKIQHPPQKHLQPLANNLKPSKTGNEMK